MRWDSATGTGPLQALSKPRHNVECDPLHGSDHLELYRRHVTLLDPLFYQRREDAMGDRTVKGGTAPHEFYVCASCWRLLMIFNATMGGMGHVEHGKCEVVIVCGVKMLEETSWSFEARLLSTLELIHATYKNNAREKGWLAANFSYFRDRPPSRFQRVKTPAQQNPDVFINAFCVASKLVRTALKLCDSMPFSRCPKNWRYLMAKSREAWCTLPVHVADSTFRGLCFASRQCLEVNRFTLYI